MTQTMKPTEDAPLYLGLDLSTQSVTAVVVEGASLEVVQVATVNFDHDLPKYGTKNGMNISPQGGRVTSPVMMWLEALDLLFSTRLDKPLLSRVAAVSGSAQQHGSVYWNNEAAEKLRAMDPSLGFAGNLIGSFSLEDSPIWADSSTQFECSMMESRVGDPATVATITGSRAYCRFTGAQIARLHRLRPGLYAATERISLVSSFLSTLLVGRFAPIDASDASGMNLMDIWTRTWSDEMLEATGAPDLRRKLGAGVVTPYEVLGPISPYLSQRFGLPRDCMVVPATGDNQSSIVGMGLEAEEEAGVVMVSLGTSDTLVGLTRRPHPSLEGHVMVSPRAPQEWFAMLCYKNGAVAREAVRDQLGGGDGWEAFSAALRDETAPGNGGKLGLYLCLEEIVPVLPYKGFFRVDGQGQRVEAFDSPAEDVRAVVESRFLSMRLHAQAMGIPRPSKILATGGGAQNADMMQVLADVFGADVYSADVSNSAALGAAYRAIHGMACRSGPVVPMVKRPASSSAKLVASPSPNATADYTPGLLARFAAFEEQPTGLNPAA